MHIYYPMVFTEITNIFFLSYKKNLLEEKRVFRVIFFLVELVVEDEYRNPICFLNGMN